MNYKGAFDCHKCPMNSDPSRGRACPMWWEIMYSNAATGEERVNKACGYTQLPQMLIEVIKASNRPAAAIESARNEMVSRLASLQLQAPMLEDRREP